MGAALENSGASVPAKRGVRVVLSAESLGPFETSQRLLKPGIDYVARNVAAHLGLGPPLIDDAGIELLFVLILSLRQQFSGAMDWR